MWPDKTKKAPYQSTLDQDQFYFTYTAILEQQEISYQSRLDQYQFHCTCTVILEKKTIPYQSTLDQDQFLEQKEI